MKWDGKNIPQKVAFPTAMIEGKDIYCIQFAAEERGIRFWHQAKTLDCIHIIPVYQGLFRCDSKMFSESPALANQKVPEQNSEAYYRQNLAEEHA